MARTNLDVKRFNEYTKDEQMEIMFHWWHYYGKLPLTFDEMDKFKRLMDEDMEFVKNAALIAWARESASQDLVRAMRGDLDGFKKQITELAASKEFKDIEEFLESTFIEEVVRTYNNPEPAVAMSDEQIRDGLAEIFGEASKGAQVIHINVEDLDTKDEPILTDVKVHEIYKKCLFKNEELENGEPNCDFTVGEGIQHTGIFNSSRLGECRSQIVAMIDELPNLEEGPSFMALCVDKHGRQWTGMHSTMDLLMQLGTATGVICYPLPRELWPFVGGVPLVLRVHDNDEKELSVHAPKEFKKVKEEVNNGTYRKGTK